MNLVISAYWFDFIQCLIFYFSNLSLSLSQRTVMSCFVWRRSLTEAGWSSTWMETRRRSWATWARRFWNSIWRPWRPWVQLWANSWANTTCTPWSWAWSSCCRWERFHPEETHVSVRVKGSEACITHSLAFVHFKLSMQTQTYSRFWLSLQLISHLNSGRF